MRRLILQKTGYRRLTPKLALGVEAGLFLVSLAAAAVAVNLFGPQFMRADAAAVAVLETRCLGQPPTLHP